MESLRISSRTTTFAASEETARDATDSTTSFSFWEVYPFPSPQSAAQQFPTAEEEDDDTTTTTTSTTTGLASTEDADSSAFSYFSPRSSPSSSCYTTGFSYFSSDIGSPSCSSVSSSSYFSAAEFSTSDVDGGGGGGGPGGRLGITPVMATPVAPAAAERRAACQTRYGHHTCTVVT